MTIMNFQEHHSYKRLIQTVSMMPWESKRFYEQWLIQSYFYTSQSTRMLAFAAGCTKYGDKEYFKRLIQHIKEEHGHEILAKKDSEILSENTALFKEMGATRSLWEPQFYKIQQQPTSLLGYILALELLAVETFPGINEKIKLQYPHMGHDFVRVHAEDDPDHIEKAIIQIENLTSDEQDGVLKNFEQTCDAYRFFLVEILFQSNFSFSDHSKTNSALTVEAQATA